MKAMKRIPRSEDKFLVSISFRRANCWRSDTGMCPRDLEDEATLDAE